MEGIGNASKKVVGTIDLINRKVEKAKSMKIEQIR